MWWTDGDGRRHGLFASKDVVKDANASTSMVCEHLMAERSNKHWHPSEQGCADGDVEEADDDAADGDDADGDAADGDAADGEEPDEVGADEGAAQPSGQKQLLRDID